ncbi:hypothetical protein Tco_1482116 [Tanacetum coccineum]
MQDIWPHIKQEICLPSKQATTNKASSPKDKSNEASTSSQPNKDANLVKTTNTFDVLGDLDVGKKVNEELVEDMNNTSLVATPNVDQLDNGEPIPMLSTTPNAIKPTTICCMSSVQVGDNSESDVE